jgi:AmiR/NasT family two-component response regulator
MNLIIAVSLKETEYKLRSILQKNGHEIEAVCGRTHVLLDYVAILKPDLVVMDLHLPGKFKATEVTQYFNDEFDIPVVYLINNSENSTIKQALDTNPFGIITDPGDDRQLNFTLELAYNKFNESLQLL